MQENRPRRRETCLLATLLAPLLLTVGAAAGGPPAEQSPRLQVGPPVKVSGDRPDSPHVEPYLAAHPSDPGLLVGASVVFSSDAQSLNDSIVSGFRSTDGGGTWSRFELPGCKIDPWVAFGAGRNVFVSCLGRESGTLLVHTSRDGGETWATPTLVPTHDNPSTDRPVIAVDRRQELEQEIVYVAYGREMEAADLDENVYTPVINRSHDAGRSFEEPLFVRHDNLEQQPFDSVVLSDGSFLVAYMDFMLHGRPLVHRRSWTTLLSPDGESFRLPTLLWEQEEREMPWSLAVDASDRLYVAVDGYWTRRGARPEELASHTGNDLFVITSDDRGESWSAPVAVFPPVPGANAEVPTIAVNSAGVVGVAWYDTRHDPSAECFDVYFSASVDGARTFLPAVRVTPETSCPRAIPAQRGLAHRWSFGGDYSGLAAGADGRFHLFWADSREGVYQIWSSMASIR